MKNKMMEKDVENMGIMAGFKDMMEMEDDDGRHERRGPCCL
jgi:hypothetical protein